MLKILHVYLFSKKGTIYGLDPVNTQKKDRSIHFRENKREEEYAGNEKEKSTRLISCFT